MTTGKTTNFQKILKDLRDAKYSDAQLGHLCDCSRQHIWYLRLGRVKMPNYNIGKRLVALHEALK